MNQIFSSGCEYAIRLMCQLAGDQQGGPARIRDLAEQLDVPYAFLAKTVQTLTRVGLLASRKGPGGGIRLGRPTDAIVIAEIVDAVDGLETMKRCVLGLPECGDTDPCPMHTEWIGIRERVIDLLRKTRLSDVAALQAG